MAGPRLTSHAAPRPRPGDPCAECRRQRVERRARPRPRHGRCRRARSRTQPTSPSATPRAAHEERKPTPWTWPRTQPRAARPAPRSTSARSRQRGRPLAARRAAGVDHELGVGVGLDGARPGRRGGPGRRRPRRIDVPPRPARSPRAGRRSRTRPLPPASTTTRSRATSRQISMSASAAARRAAGAAASARRSAAAVAGDRLAPRPAAAASVAAVVGRRLAPVGDARPASAASASSSGRRPGAGAVRPRSGSSSERARRAMDEHVAARRARAMATPGRPSARRAMRGRGRGVGHAALGEQLGDRRCRHRPDADPGAAAADGVEQERLVVGAEDQHRAAPAAPRAS